MYIYELPVCKTIYWMSDQDFCSFLEYNCGCYSYFIIFSYFFSVSFKASCCLETCK